MVPEGIATAADWPCYAFAPAQSANCLREIPDGSDLRPADTSAGLYNPTYYVLVGWPSLLTSDTSLAVIGMRVAGALLVTFFLAAGFAALYRLRPSRATAFGLAAAVTPMVLFLAAAVNPNGLEIATGFALISSLLLVLGPEPLARRWPWLLLAGAAGVLLAQSRGLSPLWMAVIALIAFVVTPGRGRSASSGAGPSSSPSGARCGGRRRGRMDVRHGQPRQHGQLPRSDRLTAARVPHDAVPHVRSRAHRRLRMARRTGAGVRRRHVVVPLVRRRARRRRRGSRSLHVGTGHRRARPAHHPGGRAGALGADQRVHLAGPLRPGRLCAP